MKHAAVILAVLGAAGATGFAQDQQIGARTKAMGGSYTAFEDDPVSVWLNPAGIATQPDALALSYQSYTIYEFELQPGSSFEVEPEAGWSDPALIPSYLGVVFQLGRGETDHAVGLCFAAPFRTKYAYVDTDLNIAQIEQSFYRFRAAYALDLRLRARGDSGFLNHVSLGLALDMSVTRWETDELIALGGADLNSASFTDMGVGGGAGLLLGLYDNRESFKVNMGIAYQSRANYDFSVTPKLVPVSDWPNQVNAGVTVYLLSGQPLRLTFDAQWIDWDGATEDSGFAGVDNFEAVFNYSVGVEVRIQLSDTVRLYPRAGYRFYDAPWDDEDNMPAIGFSPLVIESRDDKFNILTLGFGLAWTTESGKSRTVDIGADYGGDAPGFAMGFTMEF